MDVRVVAEFDDGYGILLPYIEGEGEPPMIKDEVQVLVQHSESSEGLVITELRDAGRFVIERVEHVDGELYRPTEKVEVVDKNVRILTIEV